MTVYGKRVIGQIMAAVKGKAVVATIRVSGCNTEVIRLGAKKVFTGDNFEKLNDELAEYADILIVVEGGRKSGTILLARNFVEKNKPVYAVPGRIDEENSAAPNWLISQGAMPLVEPESLTGDDKIEDNG